MRHPFCIVGAIILLHGTCVAHAQAKVDEPTMKAIAFEQVSRFIRWPAQATAQDTPFVIGLIGNNSVTVQAEKLYAGRTIRNRKVEVRRIAEVADAANCHLVYVAGEERKPLSRIKATLENLPVLTVCDRPGAAEAAVLLNLYVHRGRLRFEINEQGFARAGLEVDPLLLKVARNVNPKKGKQ